MPAHGTIPRILATTPDQAHDANVLVPALAVHAARNPVFIPQL